MLRRILLGVILAGAVGAGIFWWLTIPAVVAPASLPPRSAESRQRPHNVQCRWMFLLPRRPQPARPAQAGRGARNSFAVRDVLCPQHLVRSDLRHRPVERGGFRDRGAQGDLAGRCALFPGLSLRVLPACEGRGRARSLRLPEDARTGGRQDARSRRAVSIQHPPQRRHLEMALHGRQALMGRTPHIRRRGIAAPTSSTVSAIARSATARATSSAVSSRRSASPEDPIRKARAGYPTSPRREDWPIGASRISPTSWRPGKRLTATPPADRWRASSGTRRNCRQRIVPASRNI